MKLCQSSVKRQRLRITSTDASLCKYALRAKWSSSPDLPRILWRRVADVYVMEKTSPISRIMPVCSAVRLNEAGYVSLSQLCWRITSQWSPNVPSQAATPWEHYRLPGGLHFIIVYTSVPTSVFETPIYKHKHTHAYFPKGLITASYENGPMRVRSVGKSAEARDEACQQRPLHQSGAGTRLPVIRSMRYVVGMWDFFSFNFFFWEALYPEGMDLQACFDPSFMILLFVLATSLSKPHLVKCALN